MKNQNLFNAVSNTIQKYNMTQAGDKIIVGVSGGPDSICLAHILSELKHQINIELVIAHVNHGLRGEDADDDQAFVEGFAKSLNIPVFTKSINIKSFAKENNMTLEEAGREVRYSFFEELCLKVGANKVAVGHNMNDHAETVLLHLIRGSGIEGLKGIEAVRGKIIRPLIESKRSHVEKYCAEKKLVPHIDQTNQDNTFTRNKMRLELIPYIQKNFNPNIIESLNRTAQIIKDEDDYIQGVSSYYYNECFIDSSEESLSFKLDMFNKLNISLKRRILRNAIEKITGNLKVIEKVHIDNAIEILQKGKTGVTIQVPKSILITISYERFIVSRKSAKKKDYYYSVCIPGETNIDELQAVLKAKKMTIQDAEKLINSSSICLLDYYKLKEGLCIRNRRDGDIINPLGMKGTKKLKDYFIDEKIAKEKRETQPLVAIDKEIVWIIGKRISEKYKIDNQTKEVLVLEFLTRESDL